MKVYPVTDRGRATLTRILDAACNLFGTQGIRATSLDDIGAAAGVGRSQLYHFFVDKGDLVAEVVAYQVEQVVLEMQESLEKMTTVADVRSWCDDIVAYYASAAVSFRCPLGSLINQLGDEDKAAREALRAGFTRWEALLEAGLRRVADGGGLRPEVQTSAVAAALLAAYQGGVLLAAVNDDVAPLRLALHGVTDAVLVDAESSGRRGRRPAAPARL